MHIFDLGYFALEWLAHLHAQNTYFCCRYKSATQVQWPDTDAPYSVLERLESLPADCSQVEWRVNLGRRAQLPVRLLAVRVPPEVATEHREQMKARTKRKRQNVSEERLALCGWNL